MDFLKKLLEKRQAELAALQNEIRTAATADEVRSLSDKVAGVNAEIADLSSRSSASISSHCESSLRIRRALHLN